MKIEFKSDSNSINKENYNNITIKETYTGQYRAYAGEQLIYRIDVEAEKDMILFINEENKTPFKCRSKSFYIYECATPEGVLEELNSIYTCVDEIPPQVVNIKFKPSNMEFDELPFFIPETRRDRRRRRKTTETTREITIEELQEEEADEYEFLENQR